MLMDIEIKEEPLEESEIYQQRQQETMLHYNDKKQQELWQKQLQSYLVKDSQAMSKNITDDQFHIVEEQEDVITVNAADLKTQDELQFIEKLKKSQPSANQTATCPKCLKIYKNATQLEIHMKRNNCVIKQKCSVCPLTFIDSQSLLNHLTLHRDNYFFCSQNCGSSFRTLPLCEEHERNEHKSTNPPKIRYKHFCSFCREGFKTEVQLHVHWLQKESACGQIMQKVVQHSNTTVNNNINNNNISKPSKKNNNSLNTNPKANVTSGNNSIFPLTKLRLKSNISPNKDDNKKRQNILVIPENDNTATKRMKMVDDFKAKMSETPDDMLLDFNNEIHIKEEPLDDEDIMNTTPPSLMPEVILKTEEDEDGEEIESKVPESQFIHLNNEVVDSGFKSLLINNNKSMNPDLKEKLIPLSASAPAVPPLKLLTPNNSYNIHNINNNISINNNNNLNINVNNDNNINLIGNNLKNITNLKLLRVTPGNLTSNARIPLQIRTLLPGTDIKLLQTSKETPLQLVKLVPNTQLLCFKTDSGNGNLAPANNLQKPQPGLLKPITIPKNGGPNIVTPTSVAAPINQALNAPPVLSEGAAKLNEMLANNTIDSEDFKKLQTEAFRKAEELRKKYISKKSLIAIDNLPEKKQLIANLKQQIAQVETPGDSSLVNKDVEVKTTQTAGGVTPNALFKRAAAEVLTLNTKKTNEPPTIYLPVLSAIDVELVEARYQYPEYTYKWICPYCLKDYEIKRCLKSHLIKAHNLTTRDMEKINAQAKPFLNSEITPDPQIAVKQEPEEILSDSIPSESESMAFSQNSNDQQQSPTTTTTTDVKPIKMSALKMNKQRYVCNKCGRKCSSKTMLNDHMLANCSREPQYPCNQCPKKFYSESTLRCHVTIHTGELPHKCSYCDKRFRTRGQVTVHHRTHTGERPFVCQVCSQRFTHRETLIAHLSRHIGMKRYKCYCCDKHFSCISALKTHREIRPDTCGKVKFNPRAIGPRVRVVRGNVIFEAQPEINPYLKSEDPKIVLAELQNQTDDKVNEEIITP